jgi:hypothetical protein
VVLREAGYLWCGDQPQLREISDAELPKGTEGGFT